MPSTEENLFRIFLKCRFFSFLKVNPSDAGIYDRVVIQELIKTVASAQQLNAQGQRDFKVGCWDYLCSPGCVQRFYYLQY
jgi:hypothetical protein